MGGLGGIGRATFFTEIVRERLFERGVCSKKCGYCISSVIKQRLFPAKQAKPESLIPKI